MQRESQAPSILSAIRKDRALLLALALLYGLLSGLVGFGHVAMASPGGKAPILCLTGDDGSSPEGAAAAPCDACLLTHAPGLLSAPPALPLPAMSRVQITLSGAPDLMVIHAVRLPPARGPPDFLMSNTLPA